MGLRVTKREQLNSLREIVAAVDEKFRGGRPDHRTAAVLMAFCLELDGPRPESALPELLHEAWEELAGIKKVIRDDFCLRPTADGGWEVVPMLGIDGINENEVQ